MLHDEKVAAHTARATARAQLDELDAESARPPSASSVPTPHPRANTRPLSSYVRSGESGGFASSKRKPSRSAPVRTAAISSRRGGTRNWQPFAAISPIRAIAAVREISGTVYKKPFTITGPGTGWVPETAARPQTTSPALDRIVISGGRTLCHAGGHLRAARQLRRQYRRVDRQGSRSGLRGAGGRRLRQRRRHQQAERLPDYDKVAEGSWAWGNLGFILTGVDGPSPTRRRPAHRLVYAVKAGYRQNAPPSC